MLGVFGVWGVEEVKGIMGEGYWDERYWSERVGG